MNLMIRTGLFSITLFMIAVFAICSCGIKTDYDIEVVSQNACECLAIVKEENIDARLDPCLSDFVNNNITEIRRKLYPHESDEYAISNYMIDVAINMVQTCSEFYAELETMYVNYFPQEELDREALEKLDLDIISLNNSDSLTLALVDKRINLNIRARHFEAALQDINFLKTRFGEESHFAKAYIYQHTGEYDKAIRELEADILKNENREFEIIREMIIKKKEK